MFLKIESQMHVDDGSETQTNCEGVLGKYNRKQTKFVVKKQIRTEEVKRVNSNSVAQAKSF